MPLGTSMFRLFVIGVRAILKRQTTVWVQECYQNTPEDYTTLDGLSSLMLTLIEFSH